MNIREFKGLTDQEVLALFNIEGTADTSIDARIYLTAYKKIEAKLREVNKCECLSCKELTEVNKILLESLQNLIVSHQGKKQFLRGESTEPIIKARAAVARATGGDKLKFKSVKELNLNKRAEACLIADDILFVYQLLKKQGRDLEKVTNLGKKSTLEIRETLAAYGLIIKQN